MSSPGAWGAPLWVSGFRPFYLLGALYAPLLALGGGAAWLGAVDLGASGGLPLWHGHEMLFGFASAIVIGTLLTALPSWAGTPELRGGRLAGLTAAWLAGRLAFWAAPWLPPVLVAVLDLLLWPALFLMLAPALLRVRQRLYLLALPIVAAMAAANGAYHQAVVGGDLDAAAQALRAAVWTLMVLFSLKGGLLTPVFTGNALREQGRGDVAPTSMALEALALALLVAVATSDLLQAPSALTGVLAAAAAVAQAARVLRWRGWRVADQPLLPAMHLSFAWFVAALLLRAAEAFTSALPPATWLHAFTVGALGLMMIGLMVRVVLRHTGRPLRPPPPMRGAAVAVFAAAALRLAAGVHGLPAAAYAASTLLWAVGFVVYLGLFGAILVRPSLPRPPPLAE